MFLVENCKKSYREFISVAIDNQSIERLSKRLSELEFGTPNWQEDHCYKGDPERSLSWIFLFNAVNYCYWPQNGPRWIAQAGGRTYGDDDEAKGVMAVLARALENGVPLDDPKWLSQMDLDDFRPFFYPAAASGDLPLLELRVHSLKEMGKAFHTYGGAIGMLTTAEFNAQKLTLLLMDACPSWRDVVEYHGVELAFCKRAWLTAAMCHGRFQDDPTRRIVNPEVIPAFADYRLPQFLREAGVLRYSQTLSDHIDSHKELKYGSNDEIEIRAATIIAMEKIKENLKVLDKEVSSIELDHVIWSAAVNAQDKLKPHHRTRTVGY